MNETVKILTGQGIFSDHGKDYALDIMGYMKALLLWEHILEDDRHAEYHTRAVSQIQELAHVLSFKKNQ